MKRGCSAGRVKQARYNLYAAVGRRGRSREDKRTHGLTDYLNANTMLYRGTLFPSRLFYNSICDPGLLAAPAGMGAQVRGQETLVRSL